MTKAYNHLKSIIAILNTKPALLEMERNATMLYENEVLTDQELAKIDTMIMEKLALCE